MVYGIVKVMTSGNVVFIVQDFDYGALHVQSGVTRESQSRHFSS